MKQEEQLQAECVKWFDLQYKSYTKYILSHQKKGKPTTQRISMLMALHNGSYASPITAKKQKAMGTSVGAADLLLAVPNKEFHSLFIELKIKPNKQQPTQKIFQDIVTKQGNGYVVCYSFEEFQTIITNYLKNI